MNTQDGKTTGKAEVLTPPSAPSGSASSVAANRQQNRTVISNIRNCIIKVLHRDADPSIWIVRRWRKIFWFKKRISSDWFTNRQQAYAYANEMKENSTSHPALTNVKENHQSAL
ncbi:MAG: hypothetical protein V1799_15075 [bacterium]